ncbi:tetratricopeptide repeat protein [Primorskyibacter sp. S187A]|uniref:tetratricopeptide repeat protein n=1 Tax=Primorskyibacter sp. S187A TaxID=3415130 RepID=UPI003C7ECCA4
MKRLAFAFCLIAAPVLAQNSETLADIRQDLTVLNVEVQKLRRELSTTGGATVPNAGPLLDRVQVIESELQRLTAKTEQLEFRIQSIVQDGTNRIGDLEFRLVELEGGDVSQLGETSTLGGIDTGETTPARPAPTPSETTTQVAIGEEADFQAASEALAAGEAQRAADLFAALNDTYPGSPFAAAAEIGRGDALKALGDTREAARAYLAAYNLAPDGASAPEALFNLGDALGALGQTDAACQILAQLSASFPNSDQAIDAPNLTGTLGCN